MKRDELPALQWYSGDWRKDPGVRVLTFEQRGIWFEMLMVMHESERRGALVLNGKPMIETQVAQVIGCDPKRFKAALAVILDTGVASRDESGSIINRRMVKDEHIRQVRKAAGSLGGNPLLVGNLVKQKEDLLNQIPNHPPNHPSKQKSTPSSSSSSSSSKETPIAQNAVAFSAGVWSIPGPLRAKWALAFPAVDMDIELEKAAAWLLANPKNAKSNYARFLNSWLTRAQDRAPRVAQDARQREVFT